MTDENELKAEIERLKFRNEKLHNHTNRMTDENYELRRARGPLDLEQRIADLTRQVDERDKRIKELTDKVRKAEAMRRPLDTMDEIAYRELEKENGDLRTSIGHRIGRVEELNTSLAEALAIDEAHQKQIGKLQVRLTEVEEDNKKLAKQIENQSEYVQKLRDKGVI